MQILIDFLAVFGLLFICLIVFLSGAIYMERKCLKKYINDPQQLKKDYDKEFNS